MSTQFLALQGNGGSAAPFYRQQAPVAQTVHSPQDSMRLKRYEEHWRFYNGQQWSFVREEGEALVSANYARTIVNKKASWLIGKGMLIDVPQALAKITKPIICKVWKDNDEDKKLLEIATTGGVCGDCPIMAAWEPPTTMQKKLNPYAKGRIRIRVLQPNSVFPLWDPLNMEKLLRLRIVTEVPVPTQPPTDVRRPATMGGQGVTQKRKYVEDIYDDKIIVGWEDEEKTQTTNDLGEIPFVMIPNEVFPGEYWGKSDLDDIIDIQREFNEKLTDISDIVNYHAAPVTIMTGAKAKQLEKGPKALWSGLPADAKVFNLQLGGDLGLSFKYLEFVRQLMLDIANVPEGAFGKIQSISNTSGAALQVQFQPLVEATARKQANYIAGIQKLNYFILRLDQIANKRTYPVDLCRSCGGRIVTFKMKLTDGREVLKRKCYMVDPQTLDFMKPDDVKINITIEHSFGNEVKLMPFGLVKKRWGKTSPSFWDPEPMVDKEKEMKARKELAEKKAEEMKAESAEAGGAAHAKAVELKGTAPPKPEVPPGAAKPTAPAAKPAAPKEPK